MGCVDCSAAGCWKMPDGTCACGVVCPNGAQGSYVCCGITKIDGDDPSDHVWVGDPLGEGYCCTSKDESEECCTTYNADYVYKDGKCIIEESKNCSSDADCASGVCNLSTNICCPEIQGTLEKATYKYTDSSLGVVQARNKCVIFGIGANYSGGDVRQICSGTGDGFGNCVEEQIKNYCSIFSAKDVVFMQSQPFSFFCIMD